MLKHKLKEKSAYESRDKWKENENVTFIQSDVNVNNVNS